WRRFEDQLPAGAGAVVAADQEEAQAFVDAALKRGLRLMTVGRSGRDIVPVRSSIDGFAQRLTLAHDGRTYDVRLPLVGAFQVENALVAAGFALMTGGDPARGVAALAHLPGAKGRLAPGGDKKGGGTLVAHRATTAH